MIAFSLGSLHIYRYGIFYFIAFLVGYGFLSRLTKKDIFQKTFPRLQSFLENHLDDLIVAIFLGVLLGGRLGQVLFYDFAYYLQHPVEILQVRKGGMSFIGGMLGVTIAIMMLSRRQKLGKKELILLFDIVLAIVPFGIMLGRIGNFLNQELYGVAVSGRLPKIGYPLFSFFQEINLFHVYPQVDQFLRVNTNFLSSFFEGLVLLVITMSIIRKRVKTKTPQPGKIVAVFLLYYSVIRFLLEYFRADSQREFHGWFTISQRFFVGFFLLGLTMLLRRKKLRHS